MTNKEIGLYEGWDSSEGIHFVTVSEWDGYETFKSVVSEQEYFEKKMVKFVLKQFNKMIKPVIKKYEHDNKCKVKKVKLKDGTTEYYFDKFEIKKIEKVFGDKVLFYVKPTFKMYVFPLENELTISFLHLDEKNYISPYTSCFVRYKDNFIERYEQGYYKYLENSTLDTYHKTELFEAIMYICNIKEFDINNVLKDFNYSIFLGKEHKEEISKTCPFTYNNKSDFKSSLYSAIAYLKDNIKYYERHEYSNCNIEKQLEYKEILEQNEQLVIELFQNYFNKKEK